ncbi:MAG: oligosaccharide repeat unit polymerase family protein [Euryarchaeota archaeon]|nr:oligosaccharide repeat unit polymerase family protein [Euryarchaeota archaeon]MBV1730151.1 oligosaccharide repeat unit polymerase family protein [Methanobacterium sp.]MBU4547555.1 oligosaccharide repeat unit polymerase family protein [Euryarchaeota archaeon]MBU4607447.1 oligosaccharide repeat unit polymerase family protein [Euryarchaeota archaeon]MBV1754082.1 oligosaccharide repeat unit polymerase family protein [Methanobacterium sp.]
MNLKSTFNKIDIFSPYLVLVGIALYLLLALTAFNYQIQGLEPPSNNVYFYFLYGSLFYLLGILLPFIIYNGFKYRGFKEFLEKSKELTIKKYPGEKVLLLVVVIGLIFQFWNIYSSGGIPILSGYLKASSVTRVWLLSYVLFLPGINMLLAIYPKKSYYLLLGLGIFLFALTGYRTTPIVILLSSFITLYYTRKFQATHILLFAAFLLISGLLVGYVAVQAIEWQQWTLNPLELFFYRAGYTLSVFDQLLPLKGSTQGSVFYYTLTGYFQAADPRALVGEVVLGYRHSTTSTIFGPALLDYGNLALALQMFLLGGILKIMHTLQKYKKGIFTAFYGILMAQTLVWIETGPTDLVVWIFFLMALGLMIYLIFAYNRKDHFLEKTSGDNL